MVDCNMKEDMVEGNGWLKFLGQIWSKGTVGNNMKEDMVEGDARGRGQCLIGHAFAT